MLLVTVFKIDHVRINETLRRIRVTIIGVKMQ